MNHAGGVHTVDIFEGHADREVGETVAVEVATSDAGASACGVAPPVQAVGPAGWRDRQVTGVGLAVRRIHRRPGLRVVARRQGGVDDGR